MAVFFAILSGIGTGLGLLVGISIGKMLGYSEGYEDGKQHMRDRVAHALELVRVEMLAREGFQTTDTRDAIRDAISDA